MNITREQSAALKGIAILGIVLHNFTHWLRPMVKENEFLFNRHNVDRLVTEVANPSWELIAHLFSFFGHYGVPVFLFLSGYGLVRKYECYNPGIKPQRQSVFFPRLGVLGQIISFIIDHYRKLFVMMILGYTAFVMVDYMTPHPRHYEFWNVIGQLLMISNFYDEPHNANWPGPYWYFGLTMQIYIIYRVILYKGDGSLSGLCRGRYATAVLAFLTLALAFIQTLFDPMSEELNWYRYNFFGAMLPFAFGIHSARSHYVSVEPSRRMCLILAVAAAIIVLGGSLTFITWTFVPVFVCYAAIYFVKALPQFAVGSLAWVGSISAMMFVSHPITRKVIIPIGHHGDIFAGLVLYLAATIVLSLAFKRLLNCLYNSKFITHNP